jgi:hypothetical protein
MAPVAAQAAGQNTIFVNGSSSACTDSGTGTLAAPYCTLQVAADAANPGDIVNVAPGTYAATAITRSGTASAPIIFTGNGIRTAFGVSSAAITSLTLTGASYVKIENFAITNGTAADAIVDGGSNVTFSGDDLRASTAGEPAFHVTDAASAVTLEDSFLYGGALVDGGSTGTVLTTNQFQTYYASSLSVVGAANTAITSNTISGCGPNVSVTGASSGTSIENNVISYPSVAVSDANCPVASQADNILVDSSSASSTTADYNDVYALAGSTNYEWSGTAYSTAAALDAATGQGQHDDNTQLGTQVEENSPIINSANSAAIGEQSTDLLGRPRVLDPLVTPTGAGPYDYYDRGAAQFQDPIAIKSASFKTPVTQAPIGGEISLHGAVTDTWSDTFDYKFKLSNGTTVDAGTTGTANVSFSTPGTYTAMLYVVPQNGEPAPTNADGGLGFTIVPQAPFTPQISATANGEYGVYASDSGTTDSWNITGATFDFGDGTPNQSINNGGDLAHTYAKAGTYTITETVTDAGGNTATTTSSFSTTGLPAGDLVNLGGGLTTFVPAKSTGIAQSSVTSLPNNTGELVAATTSGAVEFTTGTSEGNVWQGWQTLNEPGVTAKWVGIAGMPNGSSQLIEVTSSGTLLHTVRNANGTWQSSGWGSPAGSAGFLRASITAMPDGSAQLVAVTTAGVLMHNIRNANGSWQGWRALTQPGTDIVDASIAGLPDGSSQLIEVTSGGVLKHNIRYADGHWQSGGWGVPAGATGISQASIASTAVFGSQSGPGTTIITAVTAQGGVVSTFRNADGSWNPWTPTSSGLGVAANNTVATLPDGAYEIFGVIGG